MKEFVHVRIKKMVSFDFAVLIKLIVLLFDVELLFVFALVKDDVNTSYLMKGSSKKKN